MHCPFTNDLLTILNYNRQFCTYGAFKTDARVRGHDHFWRFLRTLAATSRASRYAQLNKTKLLTTPTAEDMY
eukprot:723724-Lingulodinium_polyedra.AAC.1